MEGGDEGWWCGMEGIEGGCGWGDDGPGHGHGLDLLVCGGVCVVWRGGVRDVFVLLVLVFGN